MADTTATNESWYLKSDDGEVFGPVSWQDIQSWAEEGRIAPDHQLRAGQGEWQTAAAVSGLGMEWLAEPPGGEPMGPYSLRTLCDLADMGVIDRSCPVRHQSGGTSGSLSEILAAGKPASRPVESPSARTSESDTAGRQKLQAELEQARKARDAAERELKNVKGELEQLHRLRDESEQDWKSRQSDAESAKTAAWEKVRTLEANLKTLEDDLRRHQEAERAWQLKQTELETERDAALEKGRHLETSVADLTSRL